MRDRIDLTNVCEKLIPEAFALRSSGDEPTICATTGFGFFTFLCFFAFLPAFIG